MNAPKGPTLPALDILNDYEHGKFVLSNLAAKRAKQLKEGAPPLVRVDSHHPLTIALAEIAAGKIRAILGQEDDATMIAASGPALYAARQSNPSLSPTYEADSVQPFMRRHASLSWLSNAADPADCSVSIANPVEARHHFGSGSRWPSRMYKADGPILVTGSVPMELLDADDYDALQAATGFTATLKFASDSVIASGYTYKLWVQSAASSCQYIAGSPNPLSNVRRRGASFDFRMFGVVTITLVNATSSMA